MSSLLIIMHAKAALEGNLRSAIMAMRDRGHLVDVRVTYESGDAQLFASAAARTGRYDTVVAAGGDGTMNAVVTGLINSQAERIPAFGILPAGTANDFARAVGIPSDNPDEALILAAEGNLHKVDVGLVNERAFLNLATGGFGTDVTVNTPEELKRILGSVAYLVTGLQQATGLASTHARISGPDFAWEGAFLAFAVGNGRFAGGGIPMCPDALIDDGLLDLSILRDVTTEEIPKVMTDMLVRGMGAREAAVVHARLTSLTVSSDRPLQINLDGEPLQSSEFHFRVNPAGLDLHLPSGAEVLSSAGA